MLISLHQQIKTTTNNLNFKKMTTIKTLAPNQYYFISDKKIFFQSYDTIVCTIENFENGNHPVIRIKENQPQSKTTAKYLNKFLQLHTKIKNYKLVNNNQ
jgi:hypothetical protein